MPTLRPTEMFVEYTTRTEGLGARPRRDYSRFYRFAPALLQAGPNTLTLRNDTDSPVEVTRLNLGLW